MPTYRYTVEITTDLEALTSVALVISEAGEAGNIDLCAQGAASQLTDLLTLESLADWSQAVDLKSRRKQ